MLIALDSNPVLEVSMKHWTEELFEDNPELYLDTLKEVNGQARIETKDILGLLEIQGYRPKRVLDLNCGIGRHAVELGKRGIEVLGTDLSPTYIEIAEKKAHGLKLDDKVHFKVADMRRIRSELSREKPFDGILCLWTSFGFYDDETNDDILRQCLKLVKPGGFFALDIVNRDWLLCHFVERSFERIKDRLVLYERQFDSQTSRHKEKRTFVRQVDESTFTVEGAIQLDMRVWSLHELIQLFERTGWKFECAYPGFAPTTGIRKVRFTQPPDDFVEAGRFLIISSKQTTEP
jgi:SAM-dependent methyltransferase